MALYPCSSSMESYWEFCVHICELGWSKIPYSVIFFFFFFGLLLSVGEVNHFLWQPNEKYGRKLPFNFIKMTNFEFIRYAILIFCFCIIFNAVSCDISEKYGTFAIRRELAIVFNWAAARFLLLWAVVAVWELLQWQW